MKKLFYAITAACTVVSLACMSCGGDDDDSETYTVTYESAVGTAPAAISVDEGTTLSESQLPTLSVSGYTFEGWYDGRTKVVAGEYAVKGNVTLGANWSYTVTLDPNGATGSSGSFQAPVPRKYTYYSTEYSPGETLTTNATVTIPTASDCEISKTGYTFICWNDKADGTGVSFIAGEELYHNERSDKWHYSSIAEKRRLYAVWRETSPALKVATMRSAETVISNLQDGDTLIYLGVTPRQNLGTAEVIANALKDASKKITLDLSYYDGYFAAEPRSIWGTNAFFKNCISIKKLIIGQGEYMYSRATDSNVYGQISSYAFSGCKNLSELLFYSDSIFKIENSAFSSCAIETLTLPASLEAIYGKAFANNDNLTAVTIPANVTDIGSEVFYNCKNLQTVTFENTVGWKTYSTTKSDSTPIDVSDAAANAVNLKNGDWTNKTLWRSYCRFDGRHEFNSCR